MPLSLLALKLITNLSYLRCGGRCSQKRRRNVFSILDGRADVNNEILSVFSLLHSRLIAVVRAMLLNSSCFCSVNNLHTVKLVGAPHTSVLCLFRMHRFFSVLTP